MRRIRVRFVGEFFSCHSLALCNREIALRLISDSNFEISLIPLERPEFGPGYDVRLAALVARVNAELSGPADFELRHHFPPNLSPSNPPGARVVLIQPWEYYSLVQQWIDPIIENVSEVICYTSAVRDCYASSGVPPELLQVVPLGVDCDLFTPDGPGYQFTNEAGASRLASMDAPPTIILAVGTIPRKGIDGLLESYCNSFSTYDNICLVIKDTGVNTVYRGGTQGERILQLALSGKGPAIVYIPDELPPLDMAGLYRAAHAVALPYENEGFCLPAIEASASARPAIVPRGGPTDDFCTDSSAIRVAARLEKTGSTRIGPWQCVGETSRLIVEPRDLGRALRWVHEHRDEAAALGRAARENALNYTWDRTADGIKARFHALLDIPGKASTAKQRLSRPDRESRMPAVGSGSTAIRIPASPKLLPASALFRSRPTIALCLITFNEERCIASCIESVKRFFTRIYVCDTGSTDATVEICRSLGCIVVVRPWEFSFSIARNYSLEMVGDEEFIGFCDADDILPPHCGEAIIRLVESAEDRVAGYILQVHCPPKPGDEGETIVDHLKIWRNRPNDPVRFEGRIHEQALESVRRSGAVERTDIYYIHQHYDYTHAGQKRKRERDELLLRLDEEDRSDHPFPKWNWGMSYHYWGEHELAVAKLQQCLELSGPADSTRRKVYSLLAASSLALGRVDDARLHIDTGLRAYPRDAELLFRAAALYRLVGDAVAAEKRMSRY